MNQRWVVIALPLTAFPGVEIKELFFTGLFKFTFILGKNLIKIQYRFPLKDQIRLQAWKAICTSGFIPDESSRLCSKHFATSSGRMNKQLQMGTATTACKREFVEQSNSPPIPQHNVTFTKTITHGTKFFFNTLNSRWSKVHSFLSSHWRWLDR